MTTFKGVIFDLGTQEANIAACQALDALVLAAALAEWGDDPSATAYCLPILHPNTPTDTRVLYEADDFTQGVVTGLGHTLVDFTRPGEWFPLIEAP